MRHEVHLTAEARAAFRNFSAACVGTGRMGLALQEEYQRQLQEVQKLCGFRFIRGHGLFCDDMGIYQHWTDPQGVEHEGFCFTYLDRVVDAYLRCGIRPYLELGFMPGALAKEPQTLFYYQAHTVPPKDEGAWIRLVQATLRHLKERYGEDEVSGWPCEIWNEPNLAGFWFQADKPGYLRLYEITAKAVKEILPRMQVGGPAVCGGDSTPGWIRDFLAFCEEKELPLDFVSRHAYMAHMPTHTGRFIYHTMCEVDETIAEMRGTREIIDSFPRWKGLPMHVTEFNSSYNPRCPVHDTLYNAALMAHLLSRFGEVAEVYSYWTFGDVFEETGVPCSLFHGGFGMMADGCVPKPTLWAFSFFNNLRGECAHRDDNCLVMRRPDGSWEGIAWNLSDEAMTLDLSFPGQGEYVLQTRTVDEHHANPLRCWLDMGQPANPTEEELAFLRGAAQPLCATRHFDAEDGIAAELSLGRFAVVHFTLRPVRTEPEDGYDPSMYL